MRVSQDDWTLLISPHLLTLCEGDSAARLQVALISNEHDGHVGVGVLPRIVKPRRQVAKRVTSVARDRRESQGGEVEGNV